MLIKALFLDRDGVINKKPSEHSYVTCLEELIINSGIKELVLPYILDGYKFIIITNQQGIAKGLLSEDDLHKIHKKILDECCKVGIEIVDIYYCPHSAGTCQCRKPQPGMILRAKSEHRIDLGKSALISDSMEDIQMGYLAGVGDNILVKSDTLEIVYNKKSK